MTKDFANFLCEKTALYSLNKLMTWARSHIQASGIVLLTIGAYCSVVQDKMKGGSLFAHAFMAESQIQCETIILISKCPKGMFTTVILR